MSSESLCAAATGSRPPESPVNTGRKVDPENAVWENVSMTTTTEVPQRKWALTKIKAGDWLLPSNDTKTIWRIYSYVDGESMGLDFPDRTYWCVCRWTGPFDRLDPDDWDRWESVAHFYDTRAEAIAWTLEQGA